MDRVYLGHRLSQGSLLSQLQIVSLHRCLDVTVLMRPGQLVAPTFNLKPLKLGPDSTTRTKRTATSRKADSSASKKPDPQSTVPKRRKISQPQNGSVSTQIQCNSCKQTDVPLILGGRESCHLYIHTSPQCFLKVIVVPVSKLAKLYLTRPPHIYPQAQIILNLLRSIKIIHLPNLLHTFHHLSFSTTFCTFAHNSMR